MGETSRRRRALRAWLGSSGRRAPRLEVTGEQREARLDLVAPAGAAELIAVDRLEARELADPSRAEESLKEDDGRIAAATRAARERLLGEEELEGLALSSGAAEPEGVLYLGARRLRS